MVLCVRVIFMFVCRVFLCSCVIVCDCAIVDLWVRVSGLQGCSGLGGSGLQGFGGSGFQASGVWSSGFKASGFQCSRGSGFQKAPGSAR